MEKSREIENENREITEEHGPLPVHRRTAGAPIKLGGEGPRLIRPTGEDHGDIRETGPQGQPSGDLGV